MRARHNALGYLAWHFTIDDRSVFQSLPCNETGEHADYDGPGNQASIGVEICENRDGDLRRTLDRTARFVALLVATYDIPQRNVVPHYHWRQVRHSDGRDLGHKPCPRILMDGGRPGRRWAEFLQAVGDHRKALA
jgi:N-acetylmuramoyl-L-alanine amidase